MFADADSFDFEIAIFFAYRNRRNRPFLPDVAHENDVARLTWLRQSASLRGPRAEGGLGSSSRVTFPVPPLPRPPR